MIEESYVRSERLQFPAKVTAKSSSGGKWLYSWKEQRFNNATGAYADADPARTGTAADSTAYELNNLEIDVPAFVWMRFKGVVGGVNTYEFSAPVGSTSAQPTPSCRLYGSTGPLIGSVATAYFAWSMPTDQGDELFYDDGDYHSSGAVPLTAGQEGVYTVSALATLGDSLGGILYLYPEIWRSGSLYKTLMQVASRPLADRSGGSGGATILTHTFSVRLDAADQIRMKVAWGTTPPVDDVASNLACWLTMTRVPDAAVVWSTGTGGVSSVGLTMPDGFSVTGTPVTSSGVLAVSTTLSGLIKGTGSGFAAASAGTDYLSPTSTLDGGTW